MSFCFIISLKGVVITSTYLVFVPTSTVDQGGGGESAPSVLSCECPCALEFLV